MQFIGTKVPEEWLIGRNYCLYRNGEKASERVCGAVYSDLDQSIFRWDFRDDDHSEDIGEKLSDRLPPTCWVKRFFYDTDEEADFDNEALVEEMEGEYLDGYESYCLLVLTTDDEGRITDVKCLSEKICRIAFGVVPVEISSLPGDHIYSEIKEFPEDVLRDLQFLCKGRALLPEVSLIGKPLSRGMKDSWDRLSENSFVCEEFRSAHRIAYQKILVDLREDGSISDIRHSTIQYIATDEEGALKEIPLDARRVEAADSLICILDSYSDEEFEAYFNMR